MLVALSEVFGAAIVEFLLEGLLPIHSMKRSRLFATVLWLVGCSEEQTSGPYAEIVVYQRTGPVVLYTELKKI